MRILFIVIALCWGIAQPAFAQSEDPKPIIEWQKRQTADERLTVFGDNLLGDAIDPSLGSLTFEHTDVSIPGNSGLDVSVRRRRSQGSLFDEGVNADFADWELVVPKISAVATTTLGWAGQRCSGTWSQTFPTLSYGSSLYDRSQYSNGVSMDIPGQGSQQVLKLGIDTSVYPVTAKASTVNEWYFTCTTASDGQQGFVGHAPNGDKYYFTSVIKRPYKEMGFANTNQKVARIKVTIAASQVVDVNGNWVKYTYSGGRLTKIHANDGRLITLTHSGSLITSVTANGRTWSYGYRDSNYIKPDWDVNRPGRYGSRVLHRVTQPDQKYWSFTLDAMQAEPSPASRSCARMNYTLSVKHPYGVTGTFNIKDIQHRQAYRYFTTVVDDCFDYDIEPPPPGSGWGAPQAPVELLSTRTFSVMSKKLSSPSMLDAVWTFNYEQDDVCQGVPSNLCASSGGQPPPPPSPPPTPPPGECNGDQLCRAGDKSRLAPTAHLAAMNKNESILDSMFPKKADGSKASSVTNLRNDIGVTVEVPPSQTFWDTTNPPYDTSQVFTAYGQNPLDYTNWTKVTQPSGAVITYYHLWNYLPVAGGKLVKQVTSEGSITLDEVDTDYVQHGCNGIRMLFGNNPASPGHCPTHTSKTFQKRDGDTFTNESVYNLNPASTGYSFGKPTQTKVSSNVYQTPRVTYTTYEHKDSPWIKGLPKTVRVHARNTNGYTYDGYGRKISETRFDQPYTTFGYNSDGTTKWFRDANGRRTWLYMWKRGTAQRAYQPDQTNIYQFVDDNGWMTRTQDALGQITNYHRDDMGRLTMYDPPIQAETRIAYTFGNSPTQRFTKGLRVETVTYDSMFRPKLVNVNNTIYNKLNYDAAGRTIFESFPSASANPTAGTTKTYDGLNRLRTERTSAGTTRHDYYTSHRYRVTDPKGTVTNNYSRGYDGPNSTNYRAIHEYKNGAHIRGTYLYKNIYDELYRVRQWGNLGGYGAEANQYLYYNSRRQVCRYRTKEGGDTVYQYDNAGWLKAYQQGLPNGSSCTTPSGNAKVSLVRDVMDRVTSVNFADPNESDVTTTYDLNGNTKTVLRDGINWAYGYNQNDQLVSEQLAVDGRSYALGYTYNYYGYLTRRTLPTGRQINFTHDALGRERTARNGSVNLATNIAYHPDNQPKTFTFGNGHQYSRTINSLMQPTRIYSVKGGTVGIDMRYTYDAGGQVKTMVDGIHSNNNRTYEYDGLRQLASVTYGSGSTNLYKYDSVGNMRQKRIGGRTINMSYSSANRLSSYTDTGGPNKSLSYDNRGNVAALGTQNFLYDLYNQPVSAAGGPASGAYRYDGNLKRVKSVINGKTIYNVFDRAGTLVHIDDLGTGKKTDYIRAAGIGLARIDNTGIKYEHNDILGSPRRLTTSTGSAQDYALYSPFGMEIMSSMPADQAGFTGHIKDSATELIYMQARYYDPVTSRFLSIDPVTFMDTDDPRMFGRYTYAVNDPVSYIDPTGECSEASSGSETTCGIEDAITEVLEPIIETVMEKAGIDVVPVADRDPEGKTTHEAPDNTVLEEAEAIVRQAIEARSPGKKRQSSSKVREHESNKRPSNLPKHQKGQSRKAKDAGGEKADARRRPPSKRPKNHKGPWPPPK